MMVAPRSALCLLFLIAIPTAATANDAAALAKKALTIFQTNCYRCHGENGANEGGFNYVVDLKKLIDRRKIKPGDPTKSRLLRRMLDPNDPMPPAEEKIRPSEADLAVLRKWVKSGAPTIQLATKRLFIAPKNVMELIESDLATVNERSRRFARYFTLTHLYNAGLSQDELQSHRHALSKLINSLSWQERIVLPQPVDRAKTIFRIDLRDYGWNEKVWDAIVAANPYGVMHASESTESIYQVTHSRLPYLRGDWFVAAASRPPLYHDLLKIPTTAKELEKMLRVNTAENIRTERVVRAGFNSSGVSRNNRLIERHQNGGVVYWVSYDFAGNIGRQNLFAHPLGPGLSARHFQHDGGEIIFTLPNKLHGYMLVDANGRRIDRGPQSIVSDPKQPDRAVHNGISCISCHTRGMIFKEDQVRSHVLKNPLAFANDDRDAILALYPPRKELLKLLSDDSKRFQEAVLKTGAPLSVSEPVVTLSLLFESELDLRLAASEAGVRPKQLLQALEISSLLAKRLGPLTVDGGTVQRQVFVNAFPKLAATLRLGKYLTPTNTPYTRAIARGDQLFQDDDEKGAIEAYSEAGKLNPDHPLAFLHRGSIFRTKRAYDLALRDFSEAIRIDPLLVDGWHTRASTYHDRKDFNRAIADYTEAIRRAPKDEVLRINRGLVAVDAKRYTSALDDFEGAIRLNPDNAVAYYNSGRVHLLLGALDRALRAFTKAIEHEPKFAQAYHSRAVLHHQDGRYEEAIADYTQFLQIDKNNAVGHNNRGYAYFLKRDHRNAIADFTKAIQLKSKFAAAYFNRARAHRAIGNISQADADLDLAIDLDPSLKKK